MNSEASLEASCCHSRDKASHVESAETENMEIFAVSAREHLEKTFDDLRKDDSNNWKEYDYE